MVENEQTKKDHKRHYGPYPGGKPEGFNHLKVKNVTHTKHAPGDRFVKRDTKKLKETVQEKYSYHCPKCHKWLSREQRNHHGCLSDTH
jgi:hypothetical protein